MNKFDDRIDRLKKRLEQTANRHANLLDYLRPDFPRAWTYAEMGEPGGDAIEVRSLITYKEN